MNKLKVEAHVRDVDGDDDIEVLVDTDDEFDDDYEDPGSLTADRVGGAVIYTLDWSVSTIVDQIDANPDDPESLGVIVTQPPFQRRTAWTVQRQSLFIESLILGLPVPPLVLAESQANDGQFYVLDGKQRLTALKMFFASDQPLKLKGLELLRGELTGNTYDAIRRDSALRKYSRALLSQPVRTIVVRNWETPALLHLIFSRLNKASVPLASHELRQALYPGSFTNYVNRASAQSGELLRARRLKEADFRLRDAESLLRYFAFKSNISSYNGVLRDFLDRVLRGGNERYAEIEVEIESMLADLEAAIEATFEIFGKVAFFRFDPNNLKFIPRFNASVFEIMTWYFSDARIASLAKDNSVRVHDAFRDLCTNNSQFSLFLTSTTKTTTAVEGRLSLWGEALGEAINEPLNYKDFVQPSIPIAPRRR